METCFSHHTPLSNSERRIAVERIPCGLDDPRIRFEPDAEEEESLLTKDEQRFEWLFDEWQQAIHDGTYDAWRDVRMMVYGAKQVINQSHAFEAIQILHTLDGVAFGLGMDQIKAGNYEGAPE